MPFESEKQRRFMWSNHPEIARRWEADYGDEIKRKEEAKKRAAELMLKEKVEKGGK